MANPNIRGFRPDEVESFADRIKGEGVEFKQGDKVKLPAGIRGLDRVQSMKEVVLEQPTEAKVAYVEYNDVGFHITNPDDTRMLLIVSKGDLSGVERT